MGLRPQAGSDSPYYAREAPAVAEPCLQPVQVLVCDYQRPASGELTYYARHDGCGGRAAQPALPPPPLTPLPGTTPLNTPPHGGPTGPGQC